jgi:hypothetical protein
MKGIILNSFLDKRSDLSFDVQYYRSLSNTETQKIARNVKRWHANNLLKALEFLRKQNLVGNVTSKRAKLFRDNRLPNRIELLPASTKMFLNL